jgi:hypothetical protein
MNQFANGSDPTLGVRVIITIFSIASILWRFALMGVGIAVIFNFRKGLLAVFEKAKIRERRLESDPTAIENFIITEE